MDDDGFQVEFLMDSRVPRRTGSCFLALIAACVQVTQSRQVSSASPAPSANPAAGAGL